MIAKEPPQNGPLHSRDKITDLGRTLPAEITESGSFDLTRIEPTAVGQLLQVLQLPVLFMNMSGEIVFANASCQKISSSLTSLRGTPFLELITDRSEAEEIGTLLQEVFSARKTLVQEVRLGNANRQIWGRLTFQPARISGKRLVLLVVEDITDERRMIAEALRRKKELAEINESLVGEISQRTASEAALKQSEQRYRHLVENANDAIYMTDARGFFTFVNPTVLRFSGYSKEEMIGMYYLDIVHPEYRQQVQRFYGIQLAEKLPHTYYEFPLLTKDSETRWMGQSVRVVTHNETFLGFQSVARDITDRKMAEHALKRERERFRVLAEHAPFGMAVMDASGKLQYINPKFQELFGYDVNDIATMDEWLRLAYPDPAYRQEVVSVWKEELGKEGPGVGRARIFRVACKNGSEKTVRFSPVQMPTGDHLVTCDDITERVLSERALRESEARYREFAESVPQIVCELDANGKFVFMSRKGLEAVGYSEADLANGMNIEDILVPADRKRAAENMRNIADRKASSGNEYFVLRKDGTTFPVVAYTSPILKENRSQGFRSVVVDVTDLKEAEKILKRSRDELENLVAERTAELESANERLRHEVLDRMQAQQSLAASEERFRGIFETARDCVFIKDLFLTYTFANPYMLNFLEVSESEIVGKTDEELFGAEAGQHLHEVDLRVLHGEVIEQEHTRPVKGAPTTFLDVRAPLTDAKGQIVGICGIARNFTERKVLESFEPAADSEYRSPPMRAAIAAARLAAASDSTVLLTGDSGCGKDRLARFIHEHSSRSPGPFYSINCAAIPSQLAESELFGHEPGAFTGATRRKRGLIELAEGGTLLLNEISELSMALQSKLLTFFDTMSFTRVGGQNNIRVNVRLLAAANVDLYKQAVLDRFRKDLYYRLNVFTIRIPPLRERVGDLPILIKELLTELGGRMGLPTPPQYDSEVVEMLGRYNWPGNVRELRNVLERALILSQGGTLDSKHIVLETSRPSTELSKSNSPPKKPFDEIIGSMQRGLIEDALRESEGNKSQAAHCLGISRFALARFMRKLGIDEH
jgi:sigma-54 dependent transcriptional regulator, acetoin dehydrogenase operon transcriptional activator AcoR